MFRRAFAVIYVCASTAPCMAQETGETQLVRGWCEAWSDVDAASYALIREYNMKRGSADHATGKVTITSAAPAWSAECYASRSASHMRVRPSVLSAPPAPGDWQALERWADSELEEFLRSPAARDGDIGVHPTLPPVRVMLGKMVMHDAPTSQGAMPSDRSAPSVHAKWLLEHWQSVHVTRANEHQITLTTSQGPVYEFWQEPGTSELWMRAYRSSADSAFVWLYDEPQRVAQGRPSVGTRFRMVKLAGKMPVLPVRDADIAEVKGEWRLHRFTVWSAMPDSVLSIDTRGTRELTPAMMRTENAPVITRVNTESRTDSVLQDQAAPAVPRRTPVTSGATWSHWHTGTIVLLVLLGATVWLRVRR